MIRDTELTTYEELFERHLTKIVSVLMGARFGGQDSGREGLFENFLEGNLFICGGCGGEFTAISVKETELVRCQNCRR